MKDYTCDKYLETVLDALKPLTDEEKKSILSALKLNEIYDLLTKEEVASKYLEELRKTIMFYLEYHNVLCKLFGLKEPKDKTVTEKYKELDDDSKFNTALELMNEPSFQKDCSKILINDFKKVAKSDQTLSAIDKLFNISGYFEKALERGIACNHKYEAINEK